MFDLTENTTEIGTSLSQFQHAPKSKPSVYGHLMYVNNLTKIQTHLKGSALSKVQETLKTKQIKNKTLERRHEWNIFYF